MLLDVVIDIGGTTGFFLYGVLPGAFLCIKGAHFKAIDKKTLLKFCFGILSGPVSIKRGIDKTVLCLVEELEKKARTIKGRDDIKGMAWIAKTRGSLSREIESLSLEG